MEKVLGVYYYCAQSCLFRYNKLTKGLISDAENHVYLYTDYSPKQRGGAHG